jgi:hypothetical protein
MPFAKKFRAMMELPLAGDTLGDFLVESVEAHDVAGDFGQHGYSVRMVLCGPGGQQGVRRIVGALLSARPVTFSSYGNPYQLWCGRPEIESLGNKRYAVAARGAGVPIALEEALLRFLHALAEEGLLVEQPGEVELPGVVASYLDRYREEIQRSVSRYRGKVARTEGDGV